MGMALRHRGRVGGGTRQGIENLRIVSVSCSLQSPIALPPALARGLLEPVMTSTAGTPSVGHHVRTR